MHGGRYEMTHDELMQEIRDAIPPAVADLDAIKALVDVLQFFTAYGDFERSDDI